MFNLFYDTPKAKLSNFLVHYLLKNFPAFFSWKQKGKPRKVKWEKRVEKKKPGSLGMWLDLVESKKEIALISAGERKLSAILS
jgi:hypothetical protein